MYYHIKVLLNLNWPQEQFQFLSFAEEVFESQNENAACLYISVHMRSIWAQTMHLEEGG